MLQILSTKLPNRYGTDFKKQTDADEVSGKNATLLVPSEK